MPLAADRPEDRELVVRLVRDAGLVRVYIGTLAESAALDPQSPIWNHVLSAEELVARIAELRSAAAG